MAKTSRTFHKIKSKKKYEALFSTFPDSLRSRAAPYRSGSSVNNAWRSGSPTLYYFVRLRNPSELVPFKFSPLRCSPIRWTTKVEGKAFASVQNSYFFCSSSPRVDSNFSHLLCNGPFLERHPSQSLVPCRGQTSIPPWPRSPRCSPILGTHSIP
jgi:hypothetical protein